MRTLMRSIKCLDGKLIVKVLREETTTESGLYIPKSERDRYIKCEAISVGGIYYPPKYPKHKLVRPPCKEGEIVYIRKPSRKADFKAGGEEYYSIVFIEVLAVVRHITVEV